MFFNRLWPDLLKDLLLGLHAASSAFGQLGSSVALLAGLVKAGVAKLALTVLELEPAFKETSFMDFMGSNAVHCLNHRGFLESTLLVQCTIFFVTT